MKPCTKCGEVQSLDKFYRAKHTNDGRQSWCKQCMNLASAWRRAADPDKERARVTKWKAANPDKIKANAAKWKAAHPTKVKDKTSPASHR